MHDVVADAIGVRPARARVARAVIAVAFASSLAVAGTAGAVSIGPSCATCQGSTYELGYAGVPIASTPTTDTWRITYTIDTSGYTGGGQYLDAVALKVSSSIVSELLVDAPGGPENWVSLVGGLAANGCTGAGNGFDCVMAVALSGAAVVPGGTYTWVFELEIERGDLFVDPGAASLKARYVDGRRRKVGAIVSENVTLTKTRGVVPEPSTALLVALGAALLAGRPAGRR